MEKENIDEEFVRLFELEIKYKSEVSLIYDFEISHNNGISHVAHYIASITNRAISLIKSFEILFKTKNYSTAISLVRLQIDNCLRLYAMTICNPEFLLTEITKGNQVRRLKDRDGKKMTDAYLIKKLDEIMPNLKSLYNETSGFIHFSMEHLKANNKFSEKEGKMYVETYVGKEIELTKAEKIKHLDNMFNVSFNLYKLIYSYRYDSQNIE